MRALKRVALLLTSLAFLPGCLTDLLVERWGSPAWHWASRSELQVSFKPEGALDPLTITRTEHGADMGRIGFARPCPEGTPEREAMIQEALGEGLPSRDVVVDCFEIDPARKVGGCEAGWTALIVAETEGHAVVFVRGPLGWSRYDGTGYHHYEPDFWKETCTSLAIGTGVLVTASVDTASIAGLVGGALYLGWLYLQAPHSL